MKVLLLFPPQWPAVMPHPAIPSLTAYLRQHGHCVVQRDLDVEFYDLLLSEEFLRTAAGKVRERMKQLEQRSRLVGDEPGEYRILCKAEMAADSAIRIARSGWRKADSEGRNLFLNAVVQLWSGTYYPASASSWGKASRLYFRPSYCRAENDLRRAVLDDQENVFRPVFRDYFLDSLLAEGASLIGISVVDYEQLIPAITLASLIRERDQDVHITAGGYVFTNHVDMLKRQTWVFDYLSSVIVHEGEIPLLRLVETLHHEREWVDIPHLVYREGDTVQVNDFKEVVDIDALPTPTFDNFPLGSYTLPRSLSLTAGRGCYWGRCAFCNDTYLADATRGRDMALVVQDIARLHGEHGAGYFSFHDAAITPARMEELARGILAAGLDIQWTSDARLDVRLSPDLCQLLARSGCIRIRWGMESGSDRVLKAMGKGTTTALAQKVLRNSKDAGMLNHLYIMVGFPGEEWPDVQQTVGFLIDNRTLIDSIVVSQFESRPNCPLALDPERYHVTRLEVDVLGGYNYEVDRGLSREEAQKAFFHLQAELAKAYPPSALEGWNKLWSAGNLDPSAPGTVPLGTGDDWDELYLTLKEGVLQRVLCFDKEGERFPQERWALYDLHTDRLYSIENHVRAFLQADAGDVSLGELASRLSRQHGAPIKKVRSQCVEFVETLAELGLVRVQRKERERVD